MTQPLAFASDFDGTLCFHDEPNTHEFREADLQAIKDFQASGGLFGICTGRVYGSLVLQAGPIVSQDFCIAASGAAIYDAQGALLWGKPLERAVVRELYDSYQGSVRDCIFLVGEDYWLLNAPSAPWPGIHVADSFDELADPFFGFSIETVTVEQAAQIAREIAERYEGRCVGYQNLNSVDVVAWGCSKGTGVNYVREHFGARAVGGMGDSFNDLPMLNAADVAYTFPQSDVLVRDAADHLVSGVAEALEHFRAVG